MSISRVSIGRQMSGKRKPAFGTFKSKLSLTPKKKTKIATSPTRVRRSRRAKRILK